MVNWRNVRLIFLREGRDQLRDRRTLFMMFVLPLLLYPALGLGAMELTLQFREQPRTVVILGAENLPDEPALLENGGISERWFRRASDPDAEASKAAAAKLRVVIDESMVEGHTPSVETGGTVQKRVDTARLLEQAREIQEALSADGVPSHEPSESARKEIARKAGELFGKSELHSVVVVPPGFRASLAKIREQLVQRQDGAGISADYPRPEVIFNKADEKSQITYGRVANALDKWETAILEDWLKLARIDQKITRPVMAKPVDVALAEQVAASIWSKMFPALLIIMSLTGAFYPAIDLVAGEKERGTMETLLICPATRAEIVLGKFFTVMMFSAATALLNLGSLGLTGKQIASMTPTSAIPGAGSLSFPPLSALTWILLLLIPLAALFSALCLALATLAKSNKEAQYYLTPLLMVTMGLTVFCVSPSVELTPQYSVVPVVGAALLLKGLLLSPLHPGVLYLYVGPVLITSFCYSALALWWAIDQFQREEVLFREGERFEVALWLRHLWRDKCSTPSFTQALLCFVAIMLLQFFATGSVGNLIDSKAGMDSAAMMKLILVQQLLIIAGPPIILGVALTTSVQQTFRLSWPDGKFVAAALVLPFLIHPLSVEALSALQWFFGELPPEVARTFAAMSDENAPLALVLAATAVCPAICEEIAFRGFILSGCARQGRLMLAIALSSAAFGIMHMIPQQVFNAGLLGLVIGALAVRSRSLFPCIVFHFINNLLGVVYGRFGKALPHGGWLDSLMTSVDGQIRYRWLTLAICVALVVPILAWLFAPLATARPVEQDGALSLRTAADSRA
jgi:sodium transport system permease protein